MVKTAQSVAHRLKEDESGDDSGRETKPVERNHIGVQDVGVKVSLAFVPLYNPAYLNASDRTKKKKKSGIHADLCR